MWQEIDVTEYNEIFNKQPMVPFASFTDIEGVVPYGYGCPAYDTEWGVKGADDAILRHEARMDSRHDKEWKSKFFKKA